VGAYALRRRLLDVRPRVEVLRSAVGAGGASEVVERERRNTRGREPLCELFVEGMESAHVRRNHDGGVAGGLREVRPELRAVGARYDRLFAARATGHRREKIFGVRGRPGSGRVKLSEPTTSFATFSTQRCADPSDSHRLIL